MFIKALNGFYQSLIMYFGGIDLIPLSRHTEEKPPKDYIDEV